MRRFIAILAGSAIFFAMAATGALALSQPSKPPPASNPPGIAFTGANLAVGMIILVALVVVGSVLLLTGRRLATVASKRT